MLSVTSRFVSPVSTVSAKNRIISPLLASTHEKKKRKETLVTLVSLLSKLV